MLPILQFAITLASGILIFTFVLYYILSLRAREKVVQKKENKVDADYHHVVDEALSKERKIIDDATSQADQIIRQSKYLTESSKQDVDNAIKAVVTQIHKEGTNISSAFTKDYTASLQNLSNVSLKEFQTIMVQLQNDLKNQNKQFQQTLLPQIQKEIEEYKITKMKEIDQSVTGIVQKASQEIFNKSLSLTDHQNLVTQSLEKAKKEGIFD